MTKQLEMCTTGNNIYTYFTLSIRFYKEIVVTNIIIRLEPISFFDNHLHLFFFNHRITLLLTLVLSSCHLYPLLLSSSSRPVLSTFSADVVQIKYSFNPVLNLLGVQFSKHLF